MSPDLVAILSRNLLPRPGEEPYFAGPVRVPPAVLSMSAETILAARARNGSWNDVARDLGCTEWDLRTRRRQLGITDTPKASVTDAEILAAYDKRGSYLATAIELGISTGGSFSRRLKAALTRAGR